MLKRTNVRNRKSSKIDGEILSKERPLRYASITTKHPETAVTVSFLLVNQGRYVMSSLLD